MAIDGVSLVDPSATDDPRAMDPVAVVIDIDLDLVAHKMHQEISVTDFKTMLGGRVRSVFTGKAAVDWCLRGVCSDEIDAIHLLNRMLERGLLHHHRLSKLVENSETAYYRFPQDHFKILVDQTGTHQSVRKRLRPNSKTLQGEAALQERWYADVPTLPQNKVRKLGRVLQRLMPKDATRGLRRHPMVFQGKDAVDLLIETCVAKDATDALAIGNAFLRAGLFHQVQLKAPLRNDETLYRLAGNQFALLLSRDQLGGLSHHGVGSTSKYLSMGGTMDDSRVGNMISQSDLNDVLETQARSALELATSSRYWTSYRASKLYLLNLAVIKGFIDMSDDWDIHVDELFPTYCECYLTRDKAATTHSTIRSNKTLHPVWNCPIAFRDVDYLDIVGIDLKAQTQLGQDILIGSLEFHAHEVMGANGNEIVVEFECAGQQFVGCAAAIIKVEFDPAVAVSVDNPGAGSNHHHLTRGDRRREDMLNAADMGRSRGPRSSHRRSMRGSVRRTSLGTTAENMDPVFFNVEGCSGCVLLDDDSTAPRRLDSFSSMPLDLTSNHGRGSTSSSLHSLPTTGAWFENSTAAVGANGKRPSYASSETRRGSTQSDLPDINEDIEFLGREPFQEQSVEPLSGFNSNSNNTASNSCSNSCSIHSSVDNSSSSSSSNDNQSSTNTQQQQQQQDNGRAESAVLGGGIGGGSSSSSSSSSNNNNNNNVNSSATSNTTTTTKATGSASSTKSSSGGIMPRTAFVGPGPSRTLHAGGGGGGVGGGGGGVYRGPAGRGTLSGGILPSRAGAAVTGPSGVAAAGRMGRRTSWDPAVLGRDGGRGGGGGAGSGGAVAAGVGAGVGRASSNNPAPRAERRLTWAATPTSSGTPAKTRQ